MPQGHTTCHRVTPPPRAHLTAMCCSAGWVRVMHVAAMRVGESHCAPVGHDDVLRLEVGVADASCMDVRQGLYHALDDASGILLAVVWHSRKHGQHLAARGQVCVARARYEAP
eukprot:365126-Chlamydomonas_euryale.AAC.29